MNVSRGIPLLTAALALTACGGESSQPAPTTAPPTVATPKDAAAPVADGPCQPSQLTLQAGLVDAAMGLRQMGIEAKNKSELTCSLNGVPALVMYGETGQRLAPVIESGALTGEEARTNVARPIHLKPGGRAVVLLQWRNNLAAAGVEQVDVLKMTPTGGSAPALVNRAALPENYNNPAPARPPRTGEKAISIDIVDGAKVQIGSWR